jgi:hypothetical protein
MEHDPRQESGGPVNPAYSFNMDPAVVPSLFAEVGITHLGRNNNHLRDRDEGGINDTTQYLEEAGLTSFGFGKTAEEAATPLMLETQYGKVGITGFGDLYKKSEVEAGSSVDKSGVLPVTEENVALGQRLLLEQGAQIKIAKITNKYQNRRGKRLQFWLNMVTISLLAAMDHTRSKNSTTLTTCLSFIISETLSSRHLVDSKRRIPYRLGLSSTFILMTEASCRRCRCTAPMLTIALLITSPGLVRQVKQPLSFQVLVNTRNTWRVPFTRPLTSKAQAK